MREKEYYNLAKEIGVDFDDAFRLYEDLKDKDRQTMIDTLCREGRIVMEEKRND